MDGINFSKEVSFSLSRLYVLMGQVDFGRSMLQVHGAHQVM
jgi:hypothetical protein